MSLILNKGGTVTFLAGDLLHPDGFHGGRVPFQVETYLLSRNGHLPDDDTWRRHVLLPVLTHLLVPSITATLTLHQPRTGVPIATHVDGTHLLDARAWTLVPWGHLTAARARLNQHATTITFAGLWHLYTGWDACQHAGVPADLTAAALAAEISPEDLVTAHRDSRGNLDGLRTYIALCRAA